MNEIDRVCAEDKKRVKESIPRKRKQAASWVATKDFEITYYAGSI
jgi:hypothetical protein